MPFIETSIPGLLLFEPNVLGDERGYFFEAYNAKTFADAGITAHFIQDNQARSRRGVFRGLHYQVAPHAQAKLVRVLDGEVLDVVVDIREGSSTFGQSFSVVLSAANKKQLFIPRGFAHGYLVLSETAEFFYKCDNLYARDFEGGLRYDDPTLGIHLPVPQDEVILSEKDQHLPSLGQHRTP